MTLVDKQSYLINVRSISASFLASLSPSCCFPDDSFLIAGRFDSMYVLNSSESLVSSNCNIILTMKYVDNTKQYNYIKRNLYNINSNNNTNNKMNNVNNNNNNNNDNNTFIRHIVINQFFYILNCHRHNVYICF